MKGTPKQKVELPMLWNSSRTFCVAKVLVFVTLFLFSATVSEALDLLISESGSGADTSVDISLRKKDGRGIDGLVQLVSPTGDILTPDSVLKRELFQDVLLRVDSVSEAIDYLSGSWQATLAPRFGFPGTPEPTAATFEFNIDRSVLEQINRTPPTLLTPAPGQVIKNGSTFNFGWDYLGADAVPGGTYIRSFKPSDPIFGESVTAVSTPCPTCTVRISRTGDDLTTTLLRNVPGTDKNRFLYTLEAAEAALPMDIEHTLGSRVSVDEAIGLYTSLLAYGGLVVGRTSLAMVWISSSE